MPGKSHWVLLDNLRRLAGVTLRACDFLCPRFAPVFWALTWAAVAKPLSERRRGEPVAEILNGSEMDLVSH
jgi:hypothetical protein